MKRLLSFLCLFVTLASLFCGCADKSYLDVNTDSESFVVTKDSEVISVGYVQITGAVLNPGVYEISGEERLFNIVEMAGGFTSEAADNDVNLVSTVSDGQSIHIPTKEEIILKNEVGENEGFDDGKININAADINTLMTLTGIGEAKAKQIVDYRETNGSFTSIEDIMKIQGIKEGVFNKIKDDITVN